MTTIIRPHQFILDRTNVLHTSKCGQCVKLGTLCEKVFTLCFWGSVHCAVNISVNMWQCETLCDLCRHQNCTCTPFDSFFCCILYLRGAKPSFAEHLIYNGTNDKTKFNCWTIDCCEENTDELGDLIRDLGDKRKDKALRADQFLSFGFYLFETRMKQGLKLL